MEVEPDTGVQTHVVPCLATCLLARQHGVMGTNADLWKRLSHASRREVVAHARGELHDPLSATLRAELTNSGVRWAIWHPDSTPTVEHLDPVFLDWVRKNDDHA